MSKRKNHSVGERREEERRGRRGRKRKKKKENDVVERTQSGDRLEKTVTDEEVLHFGLPFSFGNTAHEGHGVRGGYRRGKGEERG